MFWVDSSNLISGNKIIGAKGKELLKLIDDNFRVPQLGVVTSNSYEYFQNHQISGKYR